MPEMRPLAALAFLVGLLVVQPGPAAARPPVWTVSDGDSVVVLFGGVHVLPPGLAWRPPALDRALRGAHDVWFEIPPGPETEARLQQLTAERGMLAPAERLSDLLSVEARARLERLCQAYGVALPLIDRFEPWLAEVALAAAAYRKEGAGGENGVEAVLSSNIDPARLRAFETPEAQIAMLDEAPRRDQLLSLESSLLELETRPDAYRRLIQAWMSADLHGLKTEALDPVRETSVVLYERLVARRNEAWLEALQTRLAGSGRTVVVVGVGHMIGPDGLPSRLRALGYRVKGP